MIPSARDLFDCPRSNDDSLVLAAQATATKQRRRGENTRSVTGGLAVVSVCESDAPRLEASRSMPGDYGAGESLYGASAGAIQAG